MEVEVWAQDGIRNMRYVVTIIRLPSSNADLTTLVPSAGFISPAFSGSNHDYTMSLSNADASIALTPNVTHCGASIAGVYSPSTNFTVLSGSASGLFPLPPGTATLLRVVVRAQVILKQIV